MSGYSQTESSKNPASLEEIQKEYAQALAQYQSQVKTIKEELLALSVKRNSQKQEIENDLINRERFVESQLSFRREEIKALENQRDKLVEHLVVLEQQFEAKKQVKEELSLDFSKKEEELNRAYSEVKKQQLSLDAELKELESVKATLAQERASFGTLKKLFDEQCSASVQKVKKDSAELESEKAALTKEKELLETERLELNAAKRLVEETRQKVEERIQVAILAEEKITQFNLDRAALDQEKASLKQERGRLVDWDSQLSIQNAAINSRNNRLNERERLLKEAEISFKEQAQRGTP